MRNERPSVTAGIVATSRALGALLPPRAQIADDPYGARFLGAWAEKVVGAGKRAPELASRALLFARPIASWVLYMQVRTRALDDVLREFVGSGGRQIVLLGAGYDARALRFKDLLAGVTVFEIDHPATQQRKREGLGAPTAAAGNAEVKYLSWDFETQPVSELPTALERLGHTKTEPTLTIWEGVTMYLTESAIDATVRAVRSMDAPGSLLAFTYFERARLIDNQSPTLGERVVRAAVKSFGEPFTFGWDPGELGPWLAEHGYQLRSDATEVELAHELLPEDQAEKVRSSGRHVAVARAI